MKIIDGIKNIEISNVTLFLTKNELVQLGDYAKLLVERNAHEATENDHVHFSSDDFQREITLAYDGG